MHAAIFSVFIIVMAALWLVEILFCGEEKELKASLPVEDKERYRRWQNYRITQFTFAINLFLTFAVAALGFCLALIKDPGFTPQLGTGISLLHAVYSFGGSVLFGSLATLSRLCDFRCTAVKIRKKYSDCRQKVAEFLADWLGPVSWSLFYLQLASLIYGACRLISVLIEKYGDK